jgi:hypothetical protein
MTIVMWATVMRTHQSIARPLAASFSSYHSSYRDVPTVMRTHQSIARPLAASFSSYHSSCSHAEFSNNWILLHQLKLVIDSYRIRKTVL